MRSLIFAVLGETVYRRLVVLERELGGPTADAGRTTDLAVGWLAEGQLGEYEAFRPGESARAAARLAAGDRCLGTWAGGALVAVRWVADGRAHIEYLGLELALAPDEVYCYDTFTDPGHRGRGLSAASQDELAELLRAEGRRVIVRAVLPENIGGMRDAARAAFVPTGRIGFVRLGRLRREFVRRKQTRRVDPAA